MKAVITMSAILSTAVSLGCSSAPLEPEAGEPESGGTREVSSGGIGGGSATDKIVAGSSVLDHDPGVLAAPSEAVTFATLRADRTTPNYINPGLPGDQWICSLSKLQGNFQDYFPHVGVNISGSTGQWVITATNNAIGRANCIRLDSFTSRIPPGASDTTRWMGGVSGFWIKYDFSGCIYPPVYPMWWGDAATILTGLTANFYGGGEQVFVNQSSDPWAPSTIGGSVCQGSNFLDAYSLFIGVPSSGRLPKFWGPYGPVIGNAGQVGEYVVDRGYVEMAPFDTAFCYFTGIQGAFAGDGEKAEIVTGINAWGTTVWAMRTTSQQGMLRAKARCYFYDQTY